ncbi:helix-turn-helix domain-containing protein [Exiguobacterium sp. PFWT01]|uniref:AraC family transcriptional regulator n=1 Tax=Exiguobacterium sp. PFWT01 TaxID=2829816 RepID=UPI001BA6D4FA|nr:AraC family transcriptional regulator [Exiguobacterium sp. PFWT01]QUP88531.1 helix-turn-helix domain-containing protein [Exiguobacterium sp. PFWT01]
MKSIEMIRHGSLTLKVTDHFTVLFCKSGTSVIRVNGESITLHPREAVLLARGQSVMVEKIEESSQMRLLEFDPDELFHPELAKRYVTPYLTSKKSIHMLKQERVNQSIIQTIERAVQHLSADGSLALMDATLQCTVIWRYWIQQEGEVMKNENKRVSLRLMLAYIESHLEDKPTLARIATAGNVSRSECCRLFTTFGNTSPLAYVQVKRMDRAATLLMDSIESVADIANRLSYSSVSHFVQAFKAHHSITPLAYRKQYQRKRAE